MKFKTKRMSIEAWQFYKKDVKKLSLEPMLKGVLFTRIDAFEINYCLGRQILQPGDWIIKRLGKFEICSAKDFRETYEPCT